MPAKTDFNLTPYFDDFSESKKFYRILFRPGFAVQARELTQSQTILQNQIERFGDHVFEKGAMVIPGQIAFDLDYSAVKLSSKTFASVSSYIGKELRGVTSGVRALCVNATANDGTDPDTLFVKYTRTGTNNTSLVFSNGETVQAFEPNGITVLASAGVSSTAKGSAALIEEGVYYINGFYLKVSAQTLILDKYTNTPSYRIGVTVVESNVTSNEDNSLNDNAAGSSNANAPGAHRFKIDLTLTKKTLTASDDADFFELLRLKLGIRQNIVRSTEYAVLEDTLARRTFDESGDYVVKDFDVEMREHIIDGNNRGIYLNTEGGSESKLAAGLSPGKAYVRGYEIETIGTTFVDIDKAREFKTENAFNTNFDLQNFVNIKNIFGSPDIGFVSGETEAFKTLNLFDTLTVTRGVQQSTVGVTVPQIGRAKSRGFEHHSGTPLANIFSSSALTSVIYKHYLFDIEMFTHLNYSTAQSFTNGEKVTGSSSGATGIVQSISAIQSAAVTNVTVASPGVVTSTNHSFKEGMQIQFLSAGFQVNSAAVLDTTKFTVKNPTTNTFELYDASGVNPVNVTSFTSGGDARHGVLVLDDVVGIFVSGETITGATSAATSVVQSERYGFKGVQTFDFTSVKQLGMAGSPAFTADVSLDATFNESYPVFGSLSVANNGTTVTGFGTLFNTELRIGDVITFTTDAGSTVTRVIESISSNTSLQLLTAVGASDVSTKTTATRFRSKLQSPDKNIAIFKLPYETIKTLKTATNNNLTDTSFKIRRHFTVTLSSSGIGTLTAGTNETFTALDESDYSISIMSLGAGTSGSVGDILSITGNNHSGTAIFTRTSANAILTLNYGANYQGHKLKVLATINRTTAGSKTKTITTTSQAISNQTEIQSGTIGLGKADVFEIVSVFMSANFATAATSSDTNITNRFNLDTGQRDNYYDIGRLKLKLGELTPTGRLLVNFKFFTHGAGDYFDVDTYAASGLDYEGIPSYTSDTSGERFSLRDCLDFRPRVDDASTIIGSQNMRQYSGTGASTVDPVKFGSDVTTDFEYYLPRIDKIFLDKEGNFKVAKGASSINPKVPKSIDDAMHLYTVYLNSYTLGTDDLIIQKIDNRRYTMRDIGKLERRIENVEYYTQLSLLETQAQALQIQDADGFDRFKNGFIVDNFTGHGIGDAGNNDYKIAMDMAGGYMRPLYSEQLVSLIEADDDGTAIVDADRTAANYQKTGDLITLPYTETTYVDQPFASKTVNVNPFNIFTWSGSLVLDPPGDEWKETERIPDLLVNQNGSFDTMVQNLGNPNLTEIEIGTVWNEWQDFWVGQPVETGTVVTNQRAAHGGRAPLLADITRTTEQRVSQTRTGVRSNFVPQVVKTSLGDRVLNIAFIPFIRSRTITFTAKRLKPNTRVYPFFDNIDITSYVTPTSGSIGGALVTNSAGDVSGTFAIPSPKDDTQPRWRTGQRTFRLTSSSTNSQSLNDIETSAEADYIARGSLETVQNTIVSTREAILARQSVNENRNITRETSRTTTEQIGWVDPIAQTFLVDDAGGIFATSVDVFFSNKDQNIPITLQLREVINGYPSKTILPFGEVVLSASSVNTSTDSATATSFTFPSPVYLREKTEYCMCLLANSDNYRVYVARIGERQINSDRTISQQPYAGVFFKSQNGSTWTADQNEDLKFKIKRAEFSNVVGNVTFCNEALQSKTLGLNPLRTTSGSGVIRVYHKNHGMHGTSNNVTISGVAAGTYNGITHTQINGTYTSISNVTLDTYDITTAGTATSSGNVGSTTTAATRNILMDVAHPIISTLVLPGTNITYNMRTTSGRSIHGTEAEFALAGTSSSFSFVPGENITFTKPQLVASVINETNEMAGSKSLFTVCTLSTNTTKLSPVIDVKRVSLVCVQNRLNSPTSLNTPADLFIDDDKSSGTSTASVYLTKPITLGNASSALDVRLTQNVRATSNVEVYFRTSSPSETRNINDLAWIPFNGDGSEDTAVTPAENDKTYFEYKYSGSNLTEFTAFQIKIILKGTNSSYPPIVRDMRAIALAV